MEKIKILLGSMVVLFAFGLTACSATEYITNRIAEEAEQRAKNLADEAVERSFDAAENSVRCAVGDKKCIERAKAQGRPVTVTDAQGNVVKQIPGSGKQGLGSVNANYDFKPGERTLFATDFANAVVGNFPPKLIFKGGGMSLVKINGQRMLRMSRGSRFNIKLPEPLPKQFTIEFSYYNPQYHTFLTFGGVNQTGGEKPHNYFSLDPNNSGVHSTSDKLPSSTRGINTFTKRIIPIRVMVDGSYVKMYIGKKRVANIPNAQLLRGNVLTFHYGGVFADDNPGYVGDIRIAAGGRDLYSTLQAEGRIAIQGIHFTTGSAKITPESARTIEKIAKLLEEHPNLRLLIEGHTSSTGSYEANMQLSKERAAAVKSYLVDNFGISPDRLKTMGLGETQPVASNDTEKGRAKNRRVEIVKL